MRALHILARMDSDRIRTDMNSDVTIYHILFRIRIRIQILSNTNTKRIFRIRALQCLDADDAPVSALDMHGRNDDMPCATPRSTTRPPAIRQPLRRGNARFSDRGSPSACTVPRRHTSPPPTLMRQRAGLDLAAIPWRSGTPAPPPMTSHPTALPASCHPPPHTGTWSGTSLAYWTQ
jgi:hypothetical protein